MSSIPQTPIEAPTTQESVLFLSSIGESDALIGTLVLLTVAAFIFVFNGLLDMAFYIVLFGAAMLGLWAIASMIPLNTEILFLAGLIISIIGFFSVA